MGVAAKTNGANGDTNGAKTRRTDGVQGGERAARVVADVLEATAKELSRVGYAQMRIEDVASRSGVNKTTIYRRWSTKADLVAAVFEQAWLPLAEGVDLGTLRDDLLHVLRKSAAFGSSPLGQGLFRIVQIEGTDPEVGAIARTYGGRIQAMRHALVERGIARGDLPAGTRAAIVCDLVFSPVFVRAMKRGERLDDDYLRTVVDVVLRGFGAL